MSISLKEFFDKQSRESVEIKKQIDEHKKTEPAMWEEYNRIDAKCIKQAAKYNDEKVVESPKAITTGAELLTLRRRRDDVKFVYQHKLNQLRLKQEGLTRSLITKTAEKWMQYAKNLPNRSIAQSQSVIDRRGNVRHYAVKHNWKVLNEAEQKILESRKELMQMQHCSIPEINDFITKAENEFNAMDLTVLELEEVKTTERVKQLTEKRQPDNFAVGTLMPDGSTYIHPPKGTLPRLQNLSDRLEKLEAGK